MSKQVDERVVSMQFDNKDFEKNVSTTMSTLDKLKQKLNFKDSGKSLDNLSRAASKVDMSSLSKSVDTVQAKFSAMEIAGVTALANITNSAVNAGKNLVKSLSIDQVTAGWNKYAQKTASVQTIMNSTGKSIDEVNQYLEKLMWFSDETSYGFTDMTAALGQMTSSGGDIDKLIPLITGVANATAYAGKGAAEFSRVMYNLNQSYGTGYLQLMDWKSLELAGVGSKQLKQTLIDTAVEMGKISKGSVTIGTFAETLKDKWADREVMEAAFGKFGEFSDAVHAMVASGEVDTAAEAIEKLEGKYGELAVTAFKSAQEAKTFTEAIDATKDAVSSQWMTTMELLFGNYEKAKKIWTDLANALWDIFASGGENRNKILRMALDYSPVNAFVKKLEKVTNMTESMSNKLLDYADIVNRIIGGEFGNGQSRFDKLAKAGYDWAHAQNLVNEKLGNSYRYTTDYTEAQEKLTKQTIKLTDEKLKDLGFTKEEIELYRELEKESKRTGKSIDELVASMKEKDGRTLLTESFYNIGSALKGSIMAVRDAFSEIFFSMSDSAKAIGLYNLIKSFNEFTQKLRLTTKDGEGLNKTGEKLKRTFKGLFAILDIILTIVGGPIKLAIKVITKALSAMGVTVLDITANVGDAIVAFRDWIDKVLDYNKIFNKLGQLCKPVAKKIREWVSSFDGTDRIKSSLEAIKQSFADGTFGDKFASGFTKVMKTLQPIGDAIVRLAKTIWNLDGVQRIVKGITKAFSGMFESISNGVKGFSLSGIINTIADLIDGLTALISGKGKDGAGSNVVSGLGEGIANGVKVVIEAITAICKGIYDTFCNFFDIHSPSKLMITLGGFLIAGLAIGITQGESELAINLRAICANLFEVVKDSVMALGDYLKNLKFSDIKWEHILAVGGIIIFVKTVKRALDITEMFASGVKGFGTFFAEAGGLIKDFRDKAFPKPSKMEKRTDAMLKMAVSIGILAASVYALAKVPTDDLWGAVAAITVLSGILIGLTIAASKLEVKGGDFGKLSVLLLSLAGTVWIMATAIKKLEFLNKYNVGPILLGLAGMVAGITVLLAAFGKLTKGTVAKNIHKAAMVIGQIAFTMLILAAVIKVVSKLDPEALKTGMKTMTMFGVFVAAMMFATRLAGQQTQGLAKTLLGMAATMGLLVLVIKMISGMRPEEVAGGIICLTLFAGIITGLIAATKLAGGNVKGIGGALMGIASAMAIMALTCKIISTISNDELKRGVTAILVFGAIIVALIKATKSKEGEVIKGAATILAMTIAIGMLAALSVVMSLVSTEALAKGITVVSILSLMMGYMVRGLKDIGEAKQTMIALTVCIGLILGAVIAMCFIDPKRLALATTAMGSLLGMFALVIRSLSTIKTGEKTYKQVIKTLYALAGVIVILAAVLAALSYLPNPQNMIPAAAGISILLLSLTGSLAIMSKFKVPTDKQLPNLLKSIYALTGVVVAIGAVLAAMSFLPNANALVPTATAISIVLVAMTGVTAALSLLAQSTGGMKWEDLAKPLALLTILAGELVLFAGALALISGWTFDSEQVIGITATMYAMIPLVTALSLLSKLTANSKWEDLAKPLVMLTLLAGELIVFGAVLNLIKDFECDLAGVLKVIAVMYALTPLVAAIAVVGAKMNAVGGVTTLVSGLIGLTVVLGCVALVMAAFAVVATALGALVSKFPILEQFLAKGIGILVQLANGLGQIIGAFVGGIAEGFMNSLPAIGLALSQFMINATPFIMGCKLIDKSVAVGVATLVGAILALTVADFINGIVSFSPFAGGLADLGTQLSQFMINALPFITIASTLSEDMMTGVKYMAQAILALTAANLIEGLTSWLTGGTDLSAFGEQLGTLGSGIRDFADELGEFDKTTINTINCGTKALKTIAEACATIPNSGGWMGAIFGENDPDTFGEQIAALGSSLKAFVTNIGTFGKEQLNTVKNAGKAIKALATTADEIPNEGGWAAAIFGDNSLASFGDNIEAVGSNLMTFVETVKDLDDDAMGRVTRACDVIKAFAEASATIPDATSVDNLTTLSKKIPTIGKNLDGFYEKIGKFGKDSVSRGKNASAVLSEFGKAGKNAPNATQITNLETLSGKLVTIGGNLDGLYEAIGPFGKDTKSRATSACGVIKEFASAAAAIPNNGAGILSDFTNAIKGIPDAFTNLTTDTSSAVKTLISDTVSAIKNKSNYNSFKGAGEYCVKGFAKGITDNKYRATKAGKAIAKAAYEAAKKELDEHSPSKKFEKMGVYTVLGLVNGIIGSMKTAVKSSTELAKGILRGFEDEMEIHSPSLKMEKDGHYVVQGVAEGIKADTSAEDAMRQKAQNITTAFEEEIQKIAHDGTIADKIFQLWELTDGLKATPEEKRVKSLENLQSQLQTATHEQRLYYDQWLEMDRYYKKGQVKETDVDSAYDKWYDAQLKVAQTQKDIDELMAYGWMDEALNSYQQGRDTWSKNMENWLLNEGRYATDAEKTAKQLNHSQTMLSSYRDSYNIAVQKHAKALERSGGIVNDEVTSAWNSLKDFERLISEEEQNIRDILAEASLNAVENVQERMDLRDKEFELWRETDGLYATGAKLEAKTKKYLEKTLADQTEQLDIEEQELARLKSIKATEDEIREQEERVLDAKIRQAQTQNQINNIAKTALERQKETHELASETADLQYQIWEKTTGREATSAEKDIAKIGMITKQLSAQAGVLDVARKEYRQACKDYGKSSNEATAYYNAYLNEQVKLAELQNQIIDIEEKTVAKQKLAKSEYADYVEKYKKFYEMNGMSAEQLEKDAKLVSGYDPNNTVENLVSKTQRKLDELTSSSDYTNLLDSFSSIGTSYISSINDGVNTGIDGIMASLEGMLSDCRNTLYENVGGWHDCGIQLVNGFIAGIIEKIPEAVQAGIQLGNDVEAGIRSALDEHSPSRVLMDVGADAVLGFVKGLIDNSKISSEAANQLGNNAVEAMQNTISRISEVVDSGLDVRPTISPVLDLSDVESGAATLSSMFSRSQAMDISASMAARLNNAESQNGAEQPAGGNTYHFEQNNYSPKALSRTELYRQTKNQFAALKGATS